MVVSNIEDMWDDTFGDANAMITAALSGDEASMRLIAEESDHPTQLATALAVIAAGLFITAGDDDATPMEIEADWRAQATDLAGLYREARCA